MCTYNTWAHVVISFTHSCVPQSGDPWPILWQNFKDDSVTPNHDTATVQQILFIYFFYTAFPLYIWLKKKWFAHNFRGYIGEQSLSEGQGWKLLKIYIYKKKEISFACRAAFMVLHFVFSIARGGFCHIFSISKWKWKSIYSASCWWQVEWSLELHGKTALQHSPKQRKQMGTLFLNITKGPNWFEKTFRVLGWYGMCIYLKFSTNFSCFGECCALQKCFVDY